MNESRKWLDFAYAANSELFAYLSAIFLDSRREQVGNGWIGVTRSRSGVYSDHARQEGKNLLPLLRGTRCRERRNRNSIIKPRAV